VIKSFRDRLTISLFQGRPVRSVHPDLQRRARKVLLALDQAGSLNDMRGVGLSLERLERDRKGQRSVRVTGQWRVCFRWRDGTAEDVEFTDYH
jgi:proteic killer suppression protein